MNATTLTAAQELAQVESAIEALLKRKDELEAIIEAEAFKVEQARMDAVATKQQEPAPKPTKGASRIKRSKQVDTIVENTKGRRDVNAGDKQKIDAAKEAAMSVKPAKVAQEKRTTKTAEKATTKTTKQPARKHEGMTYAQVRTEVSTRKAKLNKADQERMVKAGLKNNTWDGAIASLNWLNQYFPTK